MKTFEDIGTMVDAYIREPHIQKLKDILIATEALDNVEQHDVLRRLANLKPIHGMGKRDLDRELKDLSRKKEVVDGGTVSDKFYEDGKFRPMLMVRHLMEENDYLFTMENEALHFYRNGVYVQDGVRDTERQIEAILGMVVRPSMVTAVMSLLADQNALYTPVHTDWVNLLNGRLCLHTFEVLPHDPALKSVVQLPVEYDPQAQCPFFDEWLNDVLPKIDDQTLLLQLMGYSMLQEAKYGKIVVLYGPTHTGKSTCLEVLRHFLGVENVTAVSLHALDNEDMRFSRARLLGKLANVSADLSSRHLSGDSLIKQIASGDAMEGERKGVDSFTFTPFATLWNSSNQLPVSRDRTDAWYERLVILPFTRQHKGSSADRALIPKLTQPNELSGILNKAVEALKVLEQEKQFRTTESTDEMLEEYRTENDQVSRFLSEHCVHTSQGEILEDTLYQGYVTWAEDEGIKNSLPKTKFRDGVKAWGAQHQRVRDNGGRTQVYKGIEFQQ